MKIAATAAHPTGAHPTCEVATGSPTLVAARLAELPHFVDEVSGALAQRVGAVPGDPVVRPATFVVAGLVEVQMQSTFDRVRHARSIDELHEDVHRDLLRAARTAEPSLTAFDGMHEPTHHHQVAGGPETAARPGARPSTAG